MRRQTKDLYALRINFRGFSASAAAMEMNSGPTIVNEAWIMQERKPRKRPVFPGTRYSTKEPYMDQWWALGLEDGTYRVLPVGETVRIVAWVASDHCDECVAHQSKHEEDLED